MSHVTTHNRRISTTPDGGSRESSSFCAMPLEGVARQETDAFSFLPGSDPRHQNGLRHQEKGRPWRNLYLAASRAGSRRIRNGGCTFETLVTFLIVHFSLLCSRVVAELCSPCPVPCTCSDEEGQCILDCSDADLTQLPTDLPNPETIVELNIHDNELTSLQFDVLSQMTSLRVISLHENPFTCDCNLAWLPLWLAWQRDANNVYIVDEEDIRCETPSSVRDRTIGSLSLTEFSCDVSKFVSCVRSEDSLVYNFIVFTSYHSNLTDDAACRQYCFDSGKAYGTFINLLSTTTCLCGDLTFDMIDPDCSCTDSSGYQLATGAPTCGRIYTGNGWLVDNNTITLRSIRPFSTSENVIIQISAKIDFEYFEWKLISPAWEIRAYSPELTCHFYYATSYNIGVSGSSNGFHSKSLEMQLQVLDPVDISLTEDEIYADVDKPLDIRATVTRGTDFSVTWTYTDNSSRSNPETFCPDNWVYIGRRCLSIVTDDKESFDGASKRCQENHAELLRLRYTRELKTILKRLQPDDEKYTTSYYLGAKQVNGDSTYLWTDTGKLAPFTDVNVSLSDAGPCVVGSYEYNLTATNCDDEYNFICQTDPTTCGQGSVFNYDTNMCYLATPADTMATYEEAATACKQYNGELVEIETPEIGEFLKNELDYKARYWIGLDSISRLGVYVWPSGRSLGQFTPWSTGHETYVNDKCVCVVFGDDGVEDMRWEVRDCDDRLPYVCQYPPGGVKQSVQSYIVGQTGVLSANLKTVAIPSTLPATTSNTVTTVILAGLPITHSGTLHTWLFEVSHCLMDTTLQLLVLRPRCPSGYYLLTQDCAGASFNYAVCTPLNPSYPNTSTKCPPGQQFCWLSGTCISVFSSCTCSRYPKAAVCMLALRKRRSVMSPETPQRDKRFLMWIPAEYQVIGATAVRLTPSEIGLFKVKASPIELEVNDVIGFQYDAGESPIKHLDDEEEGSEWFTDTTTVYTSDFHPVGGTVVQPYLPRTREDAHAVVAVYSSRLELAPSAPYLDKSHYAVGNFSYTVSASNAVSHSTATLRVRFQKRVQDLALAIDSVPLPATGSNNTHECYLEFGKTHDILVVIGQGTDASLRLDYLDVSAEYAFAADCPAGSQCDFIYSPLAQFTVVQYYAGQLSLPDEPIRFTFNASNAVSWTTGYLDVNVEERISGISIGSNVSSEEVGLNDVVLFQVKVTTGSHLTYSWQFTDVGDQPDGATPSHRFAVAGPQLVAATVCNRISCANDSLRLLVINEARVHDWTVDVNGGVYRDEDADVNVTLSASPWSKIAIVAYYGDGGRDEASFDADGQTVIRHRFTHVYSSSAAYRLVVSIVDRRMLRTINVTETVTVCDRYASPSIRNDRYAAVSGEQRFEALLAEHRVGMQYDWDFGDGDAVVSTAEPYAYHAYNRSGQYAVAVTTTSCVGAVSASSLIDVQDSISGLAVDCDAALLVGEQLNVTITYASGSDVALRVYDGQGRYWNISGAESVEHVESVYLSNGTYNLTVTAWNSISELSVTKTIYVYSASSFDVVDILNGDVAALYEPTTFTAVVLYKYPLSLSYQWQFGDGSPTANGVSVTHTYTTLGTYTTTVNVSGPTDAKLFSKKIQIQQRLDDLSLYANSTLLLVGGSPATLIARAEVGSGSDYTFTWKLNQTELDVDGEQLTAFVSRGGVASLSVSVQNKINSLDASQLITVVEEIDGLSIEANATTAEDGAFVFELGNVYFITAKVVSGSAISFTWHVDELVAKGQSVYHVFTGVRQLSIRVEAENTVNKVTAEAEGSVLQPVTDAALTVNTTTVMTFVPVLISTLTEGTNVTCEYRVCLRESCQTPAEKGTELIWTFEQDGLYDVTVYVSNALDKGSAYLAVEAYHDIASVSILVNGSADTRYMADGIQTIVEIVAETKGPYLVSCIIVRPDGTVMLRSTERLIRLAFHVAGVHVIYVSVKNGAVTRAAKKDVRVVEPIENLSISCDAIDGKYMKVNSPYRFSAARSRGTDLTVDWTLRTSGGSVRIKNESFVYRFANSGPVAVKLAVENVLSMAFADTLLTVESFIEQLEIHNNVTNSTYVPVGVPVRYLAEENDFWPITYKWTLVTSDNVTMTYLDTSVNYTFPSVGTLSVVLQASNNVSYCETQLVVTAEERIEGLQLVPNEVTTPVKVEVTFNATVSAGTSVSYEWSVDVMTYEFTTNFSSWSHVFSETGSYAVTVLASNHVSEKSETSLVRVVDEIRDVYIVDCCKTAYRAEVQVTFVANVTYGTAVTYNWTWIGGCQWRSASGQTFNTSFPEYGWYKLGVTASNQLSDDTAWTDVYVEEGVQFVYLTVVDEASGDVGGQVITFRAVVPVGKPFRCLWTINAGAVCTTDNDTTLCTHRFTSAGTYVVSVTAYNNVSSTNDTKIIRVHPMLCTEPTLTMVGEASRTEARSTAISVEVAVEACTKFSLLHKWTVYGKACGDDLTPADEVVLPGDISVDTPLLYLPARTLHYGEHCLRFQSTYACDEPKTAPPSVEVRLCVEKSPLRAIIRGGQEMAVAVDDQIVLDGSLSYDPDLDKTEPQPLSYTWTCSSLDRVQQDHCFKEAFTPQVVLEPNTFYEGESYNITLQITSRDGRQSVAYQKIVCKSVHVPTVSIDCVSCRELNTFTVSSSQVVKLLGSCQNCQTEVSFLWQVTRDDGVGLELDNTTTTTGARNKNLVLRVGTLLSGHSYQFVLSATDVDAKATGYAKLTLSPSWPPDSGKCEAFHPRLVTAVEDFIYISCTGWVDNTGSTSSLVYTVQVSNAYGEWYPIYSGPKSEILFMLSPFEQTTEDISLVVIISDYIGTSAVGLNTTIRVVSPDLNEEESRLSRIQLYTETRLPVAQGMGNPKLLVSFTISLALELNRETVRYKSDSWDENQDARIAIRQQLLRTLGESLNRISAIDDVQQTAYVLNLLTKYGYDFPKGDECYDVVIRLCSEIINTIAPKASQGWSGSEFVPEYLLATFTNTIQTIHSELVSAAIEDNQDPDLWIKRRDAIQLLVTLSENVTSTLLATQVANESPYRYECGASNFTGQRVLAGSIRQTYEGSGFRVEYSADILSHLAPDTELFQTVVTSVINPYLWGFTDGVPINSYLIGPSFAFSNGTDVGVRDLPPEKELKVSCSRSPVQEPAFWEKLKEELSMPSPESSDSHTKGITPLPIGQNFTSVILSPNTYISSSLKLEHSLGHQAVVGFELVITIYDHFVAFPHDNMGNVSLYIGIGYVPHKYQFDQRITVPLTDQGWSDPVQAIWEASFNWLHRTSDATQPMYITLENDDPELTLNISVTTYASLCKYYDPKSLTWRTDGCHVTNGTTSTWTVCSCNHMTTFGASVYLAPSDLEFGDLLRLDFRGNPVVISTVCVMAVLLLVVLILARRWDKIDFLKVSRLPLCGKDGAYKYEVTITTGRQLGAGTSAHVGMRLYGKNGKSVRYLLQPPGAFRRAAVDTMIVATEASLGELIRLHIWHDNHGLDPSWYVSRILIRDLQTNKTYHFLVEGWLSLSTGDYVIERRIDVAAPEELRGFKSVFKATLSEAFSSDHIFMSVFDRPPHDNFTRVQRVFCCATFLYLYLFVNAMWFGLLRTPTEREILTGESPLEWMDIYVGLLSSVVVFPITIGLQQIFKYAKQKTNAIGQQFTRPPTAQTVEMDAMISVSSRQSSATGNARRSNVIVEDLDDTVSSGSLSVRCGALRRTAPIMQIGREGSLAMSDTSSVQSGVPQVDNNLWSNDGILAWPERLPPGHSRQSSDSSMGARFLYDRPRRKASVPMMEGDVMELEEIEVDDPWRDLDGQTAQSSKVKQKTVVACDPPGSPETSVNETSVDDESWNSADTGASPTRNNDGKDSKDKLSAKGEAEKKKRPFSPRTEADIDNLIEELDAVIQCDDSKVRMRSRHNSSQAAADGHKTSSTNDGPVDNHFISRGSHPTTRSRKVSECSLQDVLPSIMPRRDSISVARRGSVSFNNGFAAVRPLQPSAELTSSSAAGESNLWAWSRSSTWCDAPQYIPTGPPTNRRRCLLPFWCVHLGYVLCVLVTSISVLMVLGYGQAFGMDLSIRWLLACFFTVILSIFILEPVKVVAIALIVALTTDSIGKDVHKLGVQPIMEINEKIKETIKTKPVSGFALLQAREEGMKVNRMHSILRDFFLYLSLAVVMMVICYTYHTENTYRMVDFTHRVLFEGRTINETPIADFLTDEYRTEDDFFRIARCEQMWNFLTHTAAPWLHQYELYSLDTSLVLLGIGRLRQIRSSETECLAEYELYEMGAQHLTTRGCYGQSDWTEDTSSYGIGWNQPDHNNYTWLYTAADSKSLRYHGNVSDYSGGGYVQELSRTIGDTINVINELKQDSWVDRGTRAVILEFTLYNVNTDIYLVNRLAFEFPLSGGIVTSRQLFSSPMMRYKSNTVDLIMVAQFFLLALGIWLGVRVFHQLCRQCKQYTASVWNWLELMLLVAVTSSLGLYIANVVTHTRAFNEYFERRYHFVDFSRCAHLCYTWQCVNAFVLFMLMITSVHQLRYIKFMTIFLETINKAKWKIFGISLMFLIWLCTYALTGYLWFGQLMYLFHDVATSLGTVVAIFRGDGYFFGDMLLIDVHFTTFFVLTLCWHMLVSVFGLLLASITDAYHEARSHKGYCDSLEPKDYEMIDFMLNRFKLLIKVKKMKPAFRRVKFQGMSTITSDSSHSASKTRSQTTSSAISDPFDIDWDEVTREDSRTMTERLQATWNRLLSGIEQMEEAEEEEETLFRRFIDVMGYSTTENISASKKTSANEARNKGKTGQKGDKNDFTIDAKLVAEKLLNEEEEEDRSPDDSNTTGSDSKNKDPVRTVMISSVKPKLRKSLTTVSTSAVSDSNHSDPKPTRTMHSAGSWRQQTNDAQNKRNKQLPTTPRQQAAWTE